MKLKKYKNNGITSVLKLFSSQPENFKSFYFVISVPLAVKSCKLPELLWKQLCLVLYDNDGFEINLLYPDSTVTANLRFL